MVYMLVCLDHQIDRFRRNITARKLGSWQIVMPADKNFAKLIEAVLVTGGVKILGVFAGKSSIDQDMFISAGAHMIPADTDNAAIAVYPEQAVIKNSQRNRMPLQ